MGRTFSERFTWAAAVAAASVLAASVANQRDVVDVAHFVAKHIDAAIAVVSAAVLLQFGSRLSAAPSARAGEVEDFKQVSRCATSSSEAEGYTDVGAKFSLVPGEGPAHILIAGGDCADWFDGMVTRIYEVSVGIFYGESGGEQLPSWKPGACRRALVALRASAAAATSPTSSTPWPTGAGCEPLDDVVLGQRLIACDLNVGAATALIQEYATFRRAAGGGVPPSLEWIESGVVLMPCEDRLGRPVIYVRPKYHNPGNPDRFRLGLRTTLDAVKAHLLHKRSTSFDERNPLEQYSMVWDFGGAGWKNCDWEAFHCTLFEGAHHYPNMGGQVYVLNVNKPFRWFWSSASRLMHPKIRRKCSLVAPHQVAECLQQLIAPEFLPAEYGGQGPSWLGPQEARFLEDQVGDLAAAVFKRAGVVPTGARPARGFRPPASPPSGLGGEAGSGGDGGAPQRRALEESLRRRKKRDSGVLSCCFTFY